MLLFVVAPTAARADDDDGWVGQWVFPRTEKLPLRDENGGKIIGTWSVSAGKVLWSGKTGFVQVRNSYGRGPYEGYVKTDGQVGRRPGVFHREDPRGREIRMGLGDAGEAKLLKKEYDNAIKDFTEAIRLDPRCCRCF